MRRHDFGDLARPVVWLLLVGTLSSALVAGCVIRAEDGAGQPSDWQQRALGASFEDSPARSFELRNLAGEVTLTAGGVDHIELEATIHAGADSSAAATQLAERVMLEIDETDDRVRVVVQYPVPNYTRFHYPRAAGSSFLGLFGGTSTTGRYQGRRVTVASRRSTSSASLYVDLKVRLPEGLDAEVWNLAGALRGEGVFDSLSLDTGSGAVVAKAGKGRLKIDTGSGAVAIDDYRGSVAATTGSGAVDARAVRGSLKISTGSGRVDVVDVEGSEIEIETGSGSIALQRLRGSLRASSGSGSIRGFDLQAGSVLIADTGSGSVRLGGDISGAERIVVETGSGSVRLDLAAIAALRVRLSSGSGGIDVDLPGLRIQRQRRNLLVGDLGEGSETELEVKTGSGSIRVHQVE